MSETMHNALNALLYNTGGERRDFMLVLATNRAQDLDPAILDRCDESLFIPLPDAPCRSLLLTQFFQKHVRSVVDKNRSEKSIRRFFTRRSLSGNTRLTIDEKVMTGYQLQRAVEATDGFSGREIGKMMIAMQGALYGTDDGNLSVDDAWSVIKIKVAEHDDKKRMIGSNRLSMF